MNRRPNAWHEAICNQLRAGSGPQSIDQIWRGMEASGFSHSSKMPKGTLGARVAELAQMKKIVRVGPGTYQLLGEAHVMGAVTKKSVLEDALS